ncbi:alpha/beta fold hydrolase [Streptomyces sp. NPDC001107]
MLLRYGHAETFAAHGRRVIMPDLRGHGQSAKPDDAACRPPDVLAEDGLALLGSSAISRWTTTTSGDIHSGHAWW